MRQPLVLSLFPGIGLLDRAFEVEGFAVVRGPDILWGGDVRTFSVPFDSFDGIIGGPPCQRFSPIGNVNRARWGDDSVMPDLIPEFRRIVMEAGPEWWVMENSEYAYAPMIEIGACTGCYSTVLDTAWLGEKQSRRRTFWSSLPLHVDVPALVPVDAGSERAVSGAGSVDWQGSRAREEPRTLADMLELQGFPRTHLDSQPFTVAAAKKMVGNGVPLSMGRAIARAVKKACRYEMDAA